MTTKTAVIGATTAIGGGGGGDKWYSVKNQVRVRSFESGAHARLWSAHKDEYRKLIKNFYGV